MEVSIASCKPHARLLRSELRGLLHIDLMVIYVLEILVASVISTLWNSPSNRALGWRLVLANATSLGTAQLFLTTLIKHLNEHQLDFNISNRHRLSTQKGGQQELMSAEYQLAMVHRAAQLLISIGFGMDLEGEGGHGKGGQKRKTTNENNGMIEEVLFQGKEYGLGVLRMLICIQTGWPTGVQSNKGNAGVCRFGPCHFPFPPFLVSF